jgi:hypothetical protein
MICRSIVTVMTTLNFSRGFEILVLAVREETATRADLPPAQNMNHRVDTQQVPRSELSPEGMASFKTPATCPFRVICPRSHCHVMSFVQKNNGQITKTETANSGLENREYGCRDPLC